MLWQRLNLNGCERLGHCGYNPETIDHCPNHALGFSGCSDITHLLVHSYYTDRYRLAPKPFKRPTDTSHLSMHQNADSMGGYHLEGVQFQTYVSKKRNLIRFEISQLEGASPHSEFVVSLQTRGDLGTAQRVFIDFRDSQNESKSNTNINLQSPIDRMHGGATGLAKRMELRPKHSGHSFCENVLLDTKLTGIKRLRHDFESDSILLDSDEDVETESDSDNGSDSDSDTESTSTTESYWSIESRSQQDEDFAQLLDDLNNDSWSVWRGIYANRAELVDVSYNKMQSLMSTAVYAAPPDDRLPPRKRSKIVKFSKQSITPRIEGYFRFGCPYYKLDPVKYKTCLRQHDLQSIENVIRHLSNHHSKPHYCPICKTKFESVMERDYHIRLRKCEFQNSEEAFAGITEQQKTRLAKKDDLRLGERRRWRRIWKTTFPDEKHVPEPYLKCGVELITGMVRDHWARHGKSLVAKFLLHQRLLSQQEDFNTRIIENTHKLILDDLLAKFWEEQTNLDSQR